jgi:hypothetical protein
MDIQTQEPTRADLQRLRELTGELYALTLAMSEYATELNTSHPDGQALSPAAAQQSDCLLAQIARITTLLRDEALRLPTDPTSRGGALIA